MPGWRRSPGSDVGPDAARRAVILKAYAGADFAWDGTLVIASASHSQLASYALGGAANVIFMVGPDSGAHPGSRTPADLSDSLPLEDASAQAAYGKHSQVRRILEIDQELSGRIHIVLIRQRVGF
jgi:hypothetical protein